MWGALEGSAKPPEYNEGSFTQARLNQKLKGIRVAEAAWCQWELCFCEPDLVHLCLTFDRVHVNVHARVYVPVFTIKPAASCRKPAHQMSLLA